MKRFAFIATVNDILNFKTFSLTGYALSVLRPDIRMKPSQTEEPVAGGGVLVKT
jgi:hypothetical protein